MPGSQAAFQPISRLTSRLCKEHGLGKRKRNDQKRERKYSRSLQVRGVIAGSLLEFSIEIYLQRSREFSRNKLDEGAGEGPRCICFTGWASKNSLQNVGSMNPRVAL